MPGFMRSLSDLKFPAPPLSSCVALSKLLNLFEPWLLYLKRGDNSLTSQGGVDNIGLCLVPTRFFHRWGVSSSPSTPATHILLGDPALLLSQISVMSQLPSLGASAQPS